MPTIRRSNTTPTVVRPAGNRTRAAGLADSRSVDASTFGNLRRLATSDPSKDAPPAETEVDAAPSAALVAQRDAAAARWPDYWRYLGYRVTGDTESPAWYNSGTRLRFVLTSDPEQIRNLRATTPESDYVRYADGAYGFIVDRVSDDAWPDVPPVDADIPPPVSSIPAGRVANLVRILNVAGITPDMPVPSVRERLEGAIARAGWAADDVADARLLVAVLPQMGAVIPALERFATTALLPNGSQPLAGYLSTLAERFAVLRDVAVLTGRLHPAAPDRVEVLVDRPPAATPPRLRITGMPPWGSIYDGATRLDTATGRWLDEAQTVFSLPITAGSHTIRVVPPTGGGNARVETVVVPATGEVPLTFGTMTEERPVATPEGTPAVTTGTIVYQPAAPGASFETTTSAAVRAVAGRTAIDLASSGDAYRATVPAGAYTLEVIVQPFNGAPVPMGTPQPSARQYTLPVTIVAGQTVTVTRAQLTGEGTPVSTPVTPVRPVATPEGTPAVSTGTIVYQPAAIPMTIPASGETTTSAALRAGAGRTAIDLASSGFAYRATVPAGAYTLEVIVQPFRGGPAGTPQPSARQYTLPVTIVAGQTVTITRAQLTGDGTPVSPPVTPAEPVTHTPGRGRVVVRSTLPNVAAMVQSLTGTQGELGPGRVASLGETLVIDGLTPGRAQLVVWQEPSPASAVRTNVQQAPVTVIADSDSVYAYTGTALTYVGGGVTGGSVNPIGSTPPVLSPDAARGAYAQALFEAGASRTFTFLSLLGRR